MLLAILATIFDATSLLTGISHAGTAVTIALFGVCAYLAMRCKGRCREDEIFRLHVI